MDQLGQLFVVTSSSFPVMAHCQEFELLDYSLRSARIFFRADQTAEEEPKQAEPSPAGGGGSAGGETEQQQPQPLEEPTGRPPPPPASSGAFKVLITLIYFLY